MSNYQMLFDGLAAAAKAQGLADKPIITLGELIAKLEQHDGSLPLAVQYYGDTAHTLSDVGSYRGYYSDLALEPGDGPMTTVADALDLLRGADGKSFYGYKGGDYTMNRRTLVWVSAYGDASGLGVTGVELIDGFVVITSADCEG